MLSVSILTVGNIVLKSSVYTSIMCNHSQSFKHIVNIKYLTDVLKPPAKYYCHLNATDVGPLLKSCVVIVVSGMQL